jgi:hypothetical protein
MTNIKEIEKAIVDLPLEQLAEFRAWFEEFDAQSFDAAIERDVEAGKLDRLAEEAIAEYKKGRIREL